MCRDKLGQLDSADHCNVSSTVQEYGCPATNDPFLLDNRPVQHLYWAILAKKNEVNEF